MGIPICDRFSELGWKLQRINNGDRPREPERYKNLGAEIWMTGARKIERGEIILPDDKSLFAQLTSRQAFPNSSGQMVLETKEQMRARGLPSPDRADAILGSLYVPKIKKLLYG